jgi:microsomal triglyceride transfer protein large subunit
LDVIAAAQTAEAHQAAIEVVNFKSKSDIELPERYLVAVSLSTHPSEFLLKGSYLVIGGVKIYFNICLLADLLSLCRSKIPNENLVQTATLSLASVAKTFRSIQNSDSLIVGEVRQFLLEKLEGCGDETCRKLYLRSLKNLAMADTLPVIMKYIDSTERKTSVTAVKALRALPAEVFDAVVKGKLEKIYFQVDRRYDSSARTLALDMLLEHEPTSEFLALALISMNSKEAKEISSYTLQRLIEFAGNNPTISAQIKQILNTNPAINNYHVLAQDGQSTAFTRSMYRDVNGNGSFRYFLLFFSK